MPKFAAIGSYRSTESKARKKLDEVVCQTGGVRIVHTALFTAENEDAAISIISPVKAELEHGEDLILVCISRDMLNEDFANPGLTTWLRTNT